MKIDSKKSLRARTVTRQKQWGTLPVWMVFAISLTVTGQAQAAAETAPEALLQQLGLSAATVQTLTLPQTKSAAGFVVQVELAGTTFAIPLQPWSLRSADFRLLERGAGGAVTEISAPAPTTYRGTVEGLAGTKVAASLRSDGLWAWIEMPQQRWLVQPVAGGGHAVYRQEDAVSSLSSCATSPPVPTAEQSQPPTQKTGPRPALTPTELALASTGVSILELAVDTDLELYQYHGFSAAAVLADVESIVNAVNLIYENQFQISHTLTAVVMRITEEENLGWSWPEFKLDKLREDWLLNHTDIRRDLVHHFCERDIDGTIVGIAYNGAICVANSYSFGISQTHYDSDFSRRVALTAHEIGHNWSASHCDGDGDCQIMCSAVDGCAPEIGVFGSTAAAEISAHKAAATCLTPAYTSVVYVDDTVPFPGAGTFGDPYATIGLGVANSLDGGFLFVRAGQYTETPTITRRVVVKTGEGPVVIGP
jgi:hypothetical protein